MGERVVWRGRRGTMVIACDRFPTHDEFSEWSRAWR